MPVISFGVLELKKAFIGEVLNSISRVGHNGFCFPSWFDSYSSKDLKLARKLPRSPSSSQMSIASLNVWYLVKIFNHASFLSNI